MNIFILDQHKIVIDGLIAILNKRKGFNVKGYATNIADAICWLNENDVDLLITEVVFSNDDALELLKPLRKNKKEIKILILTGDNRIKKIQELFKLGVNGFIEKHNETKQFIEALNCIKRGQSYIGEDLRNKIIENFSQSKPQESENINEILNSITNRELEIIKLICDGWNSKEISSQLFISFNTVETHRKRIFQKLKIKNSIALLRFAIKHDLIE
ncbi:response regulator transcription factor [Faecalibacter sp. LW9]|uniref:response regulator transcription factor n=1 Tax=Faecalibacter sp. LW9 TaxID=3103144 RepID=UPI002AFF346F|nr:response regulator transcription factor [Faecalibacter sp. LW9]